MNLIVGLGNPGKEYQFNRHNIGFMVLDHFARESQLTFKKKRLYHLAQDGDTVLIKPRTFMNRSGLAVAAAAAGFKAQDILVIVDDVNLDYGFVRLRREGGFGGHNGLRSIFHETGKSDFKRMRIGVGSPRDIPLRDFVLDDFGKSDIPVLDEVFRFSFILMKHYIRAGFEETLNYYSRNVKSYSETISELRIGQRGPVSGAE